MVDLCCPTWVLCSKQVSLELVILQIETEWKDLDVLTASNSFLWMEVHADLSHMFLIMDCFIFSFPKLPLSMSEMFNLT